MSAVVVSLLAEIAAVGGLGLADAGRRLPGRLGAGVNPSTVFRWARRGVLAAGGGRVRLEAVRVGGRWLTTAPAIARFADALTGQPQKAAAAPPNCRALAASAGELAAAKLRAEGF